MKKMATAGAAILTFVLVFGILSAQEKPLEKNFPVTYSQFPSYNTQEKILLQAISDTAEKKELLKKSNDSLARIRPLKANKIINELKKELAFNNKLKKEPKTLLVEENENTSNDYFIRVDTVRLPARIDTVFVERPRKSIFGFFKKKNKH